MKILNDNHYKITFPLNPDALANERLMFIADRIMMKWRLLGTAMGITKNRMDMAEYDVIGSPEKVSSRQ